LSLKKLHARDNQIETFDGFSGKMRKLEYINVRWVGFRLPLLWLYKFICWQRL